jgi:hypothetical protein
VTTKPDRRPPAPFQTQDEKPNGEIQSILSVSVRQK